MKDYDPHYLLLAVNAVKSGKMTAVVASKFYGVPRTTIITRIARNIEWIQREAGFIHFYWNFEETLKNQFSQIFDLNIGDQFWLVEILFTLWQWMQS